MLCKLQWLMRHVELRFGRHNLCTAARAMRPSLPPFPRSISIHMSVPDNKNLGSARDHACRAPEQLLLLDRRWQTTRGSLPGTVSGPVLGSNWTAQSSAYGERHTVASWRARARDAPHLVALPPRRGLRPSRLTQLLK